MPPSEASVFCVVPSIFRSKRPGSLLGERVFFTSIVPGLRTFEIVHTTVSFLWTVTPERLVPVPDSAADPFLVQAIELV